MKNGPEINRFQARSVISRDLSKPSPSATRPPHRGEKPKYTTAFELRGGLLSPRFSLKLSLPAPRTGPATAATAPSACSPECSGSFRLLSSPEVLGAGQFPCMSCCPRSWTPRICDEEESQEAVVAGRCRRYRFSEPLHSSPSAHQSAGWSGARQIHPVRSIAGDVARTACVACAGGRMDRRGILALAHRGVTHVRGKDCVHPDIGLVIVRMISFPARESGQRARMAVR